MTNDHVRVMLMYRVDSHVTLHDSLCLNSLGDFRVPLVLLMRPDSFLKISALYKSFTYLLTYLLTYDRGHKRRSMPKASGNGPRLHGDSR